MSTGNNGEYYPIGKVAKITGIKPTVLRFWESEFKMLSPVKNKFGHRVYRKSDIDVVLRIKKLLYEDGLTIKGARNALEKSTKISGDVNIPYIRKELEDALKLLRERKK